MREQRGTRREHIARRGRKKPTPLWVVKARRYALLAGFATLALAGPYYALSSGWVGNKVDAAYASWLEHTAQAGLTANNIFVTGRSETAAADVTMAMNVTKDQALLAFNPTQARKQLKTLTWVKDARVERRFPNTIRVELTERTPLGFYQQKGKLVLVDADAATLATDGLDRWAGLPVLVGEGAPQAADKLMAALKEHPDLLKRVKAMTYFNQRRWNLRLNNNIDVLLPETDMARALERLQRAQADGKLLDKDIVAVDLRLKDRLIITPNRAAVIRQNAPKEGI
jgi:cell division protein FtsQ